MRVHFRLAAWRIAVAAAAAAIGLSDAAGVAAQARIEVPEGCGSESELKRELGRLLGEERAQEAWPVRLQIEGDADGYALELVLPGETRRVRDADCRALFKSAVVMAAAVVDPSLAQPSAQQAEPSAPVQKEAASKEEDEPEAEEPEADEGAEAGAGAADAVGFPLRAELALGGGAALGVPPRLAPLLELSVAAASGAFGVALAGRYLFATEARSAGREVDVEGYGGRLTALYDPLPWLRVQAGVALDRLSGRGSGPRIASTSDAGALLAIVAELEARPVRFGQLWVALGLSGQYSLLRPSFEINGYGRVYRVPAFGGALVMRVGWEFL